MSLVKLLKCNKEDKVFNLLQGDYDPNEVDKKTKKTPCHYCVEKGMYEVLESLLDPINPDKMPDLTLRDTNNEVI